MLFSRQLPLPALIELCRALRHNLGAGLTLRDYDKPVVATRGGWSGWLSQSGRARCRTTWASGARRTSVARTTGR